MERISEIDGLRALAALSVFANHVLIWTLVRATGSGLRSKSRFGSKDKESKVATKSAEPLVPLLVNVREGIEIT
jgi:hypothetical protein